MLVKWNSTACTLHEHATVRWIFPLPWKTTCINTWCLQYVDSSTTGRPMSILHHCLWFVQKGVTVKEVFLSKKSLDSSDVFILDTGLELWQWNGKTCNKDEKFKAVQFLQQIKVLQNYFSTLYHSCRMFISRTSTLGVCICYLYA